jgi:hypothetical protein
VDTSFDMVNFDDFQPGNSYQNPDDELGGWIVLALFI